MTSEIWIYSNLNAAVTVIGNFQRTMNIISEISWHDMAKRWAIGEVLSERFCNDQSIGLETLSLLTSGDINKKEEGIRRHHNMTRGPFINSIPRDTKWFLASLALLEDEFSGLRTIKDTGWENYSSGSYRFCDAANYLLSNPTADPGIWSIVCKLRDGNIDLTGITFISETEKGPYIITEGHGRLVAIYYHSIVKGTKLFEGNTIEVVLGLSKTKWCWSPV